jgi:hypothetical protein
MRNLLRKLKVLLKAAPTYGAIAVALLTVVSTSVVPVLPVAIGIKVAAWIAAALGIVQAVVSVVSRVTPILFPEDKGLLPVEQSEPFVNVVGSDEFWRRDDRWDDVA